MLTRTIAKAKCRHNRPELFLAKTACWLGVVLVLLNWPVVQAVTVSGGPNFPGNQGPSAALDGNPATYWAGDPGKDAWVLVFDQGRKAKLNTITVQYFSLRYIAKTTTVLISDDGQSWTEVGVLPVAESATLEVKRETRYLKFDMKEKSQDKQPAIREVKFALGDGSGQDSVSPAPSTRAAKITVSGGPNFPGNQGPSAALDGNPATYWAGDPGKDAWQLVFDQGRKVALNAITVQYFSLRYIAKTTIALISDDGQSWTEVGVLPLAENASLEVKRETRFLKLDMKEKSQDKQPAIREVKFTVSDSAGAQDSALTTTATASASKGIGNEWPKQAVEVTIPVSDGGKQMAVWFTPAADAPKPLLVGLHTWSSSYASAGGDAIYAQWCVSQGWAFIHPDFRGPNNSPDAMGSERAMTDILEAVEWAKTQTKIDETRVYLIGVSGGGHMALQMAGRHPGLWAGVSAWCGISDLSRWYFQHLKDGKPDNYARNIESALGHPPTPEDPEAWARSPLSSLAAAAGLPLDINHGINDGRAGSVPFTHSLLAFNTIVPEADRLSPGEVLSFYANRTLPTGWLAPTPDPLYGEKRVRFRKLSGDTRITIFEGGHEIVHPAALNWLAQQRKGKPAVWTIENAAAVDAGKGDSGK